MVPSSHRTLGGCFLLNVSERSHTLEYEHIGHPTEVGLLLQKDDKWVVVIVTLIAIIIISYFGLQKLRGNEEPVQASIHHTEKKNSTKPEHQDSGGNDHTPRDSFWETASGNEVHLWLYGTDQGTEQLVSRVEDHLPDGIDATVHNETTADTFLVETWLKVVDEEPLPENSWVLLQWHKWQDHDLTTFENVLRQLLSEQPQLAVTIVSEGDNIDEHDVGALIDAYDLSWITTEQLPEQLTNVSLAQLPEKPLFDGFSTTEWERIDSTDLFHGHVELRPISSEDHSFTFDQYYALYEPGQQVDYEVAGEHVGLVYLTDSNGGIGTVEVDGEPVAEIDCYSESLSQQVQWVRLENPEAQTLSIKYTGERHDAATDSQVFVEGIIAVE